MGSRTCDGAGHHPIAAPSAALALAHRALSVRAAICWKAAQRATLYALPLPSPIGCSPAVPEVRPVVLAPLRATEARQGHARARRSPECGGCRSREIGCTRNQFFDRERPPRGPPLLRALRVAEGPHRAPHLGALLTTVFTAALVAKWHAFLRWCAVKQSNRDGGHRNTSGDFQSFSRFTGNLAALPTAVVPLVQAEGALARIAERGGGSRDVRLRRAQCSDSADDARRRRSTRRGNHSATVHTAARHGLLRQECFRAAAELAKTS